MRTYVSGPLACCWLFPALLSAAHVKGTVIDPSGAPIAGAQVSVVSRVGVEAQTVSSTSGGFELSTPGIPGAKLVVTAPGFSTRTLPAEGEVSGLTDGSVCPTLRLWGRRFRLPTGFQHSIPLAASISCGSTTRLRKESSSPGQPIARPSNCVK